MRDLLLPGIIWAYGIISQIFAIIFFVDICKYWDSLFAIILFGPIAAEIKAIFWIFTIW